MAGIKSSPADAYLYQQIRDEIRNRIESGVYPQGMRLPSTRNFVEEFTTTAVTVNKAMGVLVDSGHIRRVPKSGSFVNPRSSWDGNSRTKTGLVGIIAFDTKASVYWTKVVEAMQDALEEWGYHAVICHSDHSFSKASSYVEDLSRKGIDGLIYVPIEASDSREYERLNQEVIAKIEESNIPFLLFDRKLEGTAYSSVTTDGYSAAKKLTRILAEQGCTHPVCISVSYAESTGQREQGFIDEAEKSGLTLGPNSIRRLAGNRIREDNIHSLRDILLQKPDFDGLFIANSGLYKGFLRVEELLGRIFDVPIVTFRDIETAQSMRPIARALQSVDSFGYSAGDLLARTLEGEAPGGRSGSAIHLVLPFDVEFSPASSPLERATHNFGQAGE